MKSVNILFFSLLVLSFALISTLKTNIKSKIKTSTGKLQEKEFPSTTNLITTKVQIAAKKKAAKKKAAKKKAKKKKKSVLTLNAKACKELAGYIKAFKEVKALLKSLVDKFKAHIILYQKWRKATKSKKEKLDLKRKEKHIINAYINECLLVDGIYVAANKRRDLYKNKCGGKAGKKSNPNKTILVQFVKMLNNRLKELNMEPENKAFIQVSNKYLVKEN